MAIGWNDPNEAVQNIMVLHKGFGWSSPQLCIPHAPATRCCKLLSGEDLLRQCESTISLWPSPAGT